jgi:hypothetical protein
MLNDHALEGPSLAPIDTHREVLFHVENLPVFKDSILFHRDVLRTGGTVRAMFAPEGDEVVVRAPNGAVPCVKVSELMWHQHPEDILFQEFVDQFRAQVSDFSRRTPSRYDFAIWKLGRASVL